MDKTYNHKKVESKIYEAWEDEDYFAPKSDKDPKFRGKPYVIPIPPPNVTGSLHTGHAYMLAVEDLMIRYKRMKWFDTLWIPGTDHAGIATQNVVEKELAKKGETRQELGRKNFIKEVWKRKEIYHKNITDQIKAMGSSCDWKRERFTLDEGLSKAVRHAFVTLYNRGLIYRGEYMINWCPRCQTVLADDEVEHEETKGNLWYFKYPLLENKKEHVTVATTRPETMLGDTAVAVNPKDIRYKEFIGKKVLLPIVERKIEIIADAAVDPKFGTGAVKVTPAHDPNDYQTALRHNLEFVKVIGEDGIMTKNAGAYASYDRYEAREAIIEEMDKLNLLERTDPHSHAVGHCYRCHAVIEPMLSKQWFVKSSKIAKKAVASFLNKELVIIPKRFGKIYTDWLKNMRDWCISRQLWWGHQIPVWYCKEQRNEKCRVKEGIIVAENEPKICPYCGSKKIVQDPDVLDTWFSSSLWPFSILGWPEKTNDYKRFYPTTMLETGYDILFFWIARMTMMGLEFTGKSPFREVYIHGLIRDEKGRKMSKSLGNIVDPLGIIDNFGADALRLTYLIGTSPGNDVNLSLDKVRGNRNFNNKLWNIARYISGGSKINEYRELRLETVADKWIVSRLQKLIARVEKTLDKYRFSNAGEDIMSFVWEEFADWYIELSKSNKNGSVLYYCYEIILKLLHSFTPFITEHLWDILGYKEKYKISLIEAEWPGHADKLVDDKAERGISFVIDLIKAIRKFKFDQRIEPATVLDRVYILDPKFQYKEVVEENILAIQKMAKVSEVSTRKEKIKEKHAFFVNGLLCQITLGEKVAGDIKKLKKTLEKQVARIEERLKRINQKLGNKEFVKNAPKEIVKREKDSKKNLENEKKKLGKELRNL